MTQATSRLTDLHDAALRSGGDADWLKFYQTLAGSSLIVPLQENAGDTAKPALAHFDGLEALQAYPDLDSYADALSTPGPYMEMPGAELAQLLDGQGTPLLLQTEPPIILAAEQLAWIAGTYTADVEETTGAGVTVSAPADLPEAAIDLLGQTTDALGTECREAWLVAMAEEGQEREVVLVLSLDPSASKLEGQIAETLTRAVQPALDERFAVACAAPDTALLRAARQHGIGLRGA